MGLLFNDVAFNETENPMTHFAQSIRTRAAVALFGAIAIASMAAPVEASGKPGAEQFAGQICQSIIRVQPGESQFDGCVSSLTDSLESARGERAVVQARHACFAQGLRSGSADLSLCLLRAADTKPGPGAIELPAIASVTVGIMDDPQSSKSYFAVSPDTKFRRDQQACARLGFDPAFGAFANCVADLQGMLQAIDAPEG
jgi:hypothetical protein